MNEWNILTYVYSAFCRADWYYWVIQIKDFWSWNWYWSPFSFLGHQIPAFWHVPLRLIQTQKVPCHVWMRRTEPKQVEGRSSRAGHTQFSPRRPGKSCVRKCTIYIYFFFFKLLVFECNFWIHSWIVKYGWNGINDANVFKRQHILLKKGTCSWFITSKWG